MALDERANFAKSTLASGIDNSTTSIVVASGAKFPTPTVGYNLVIWNMTDYPNPADDPNVEIVRATGLSTDTFTVTRGQEGTSASAHNTLGKDYGVALTITAKTIEDIENEIPEAYTLPTAAADTLGGVKVGTGLSITEGVLSSTATGGGIDWTVITDSQNAEVDNGYIANKETLLTLTLPDTASAGSVVAIGGYGIGGWKIAQNASEKIIFGNMSTTEGVTGYLASTNQYDAVELVCVIANTTWLVVGSIGNITVA